MKAVRDALLAKQANYRQTAAELAVREMQLEKQLREARELREAALQCSRLIDETLADIAAAERPSRLAALGSSLGRRAGAQEAPKEAAEGAIGETPSRSSGKPHPEASGNAPSKPPATPLPG